MTDQNGRQRDNTITDPFEQEPAQQERREFLRSLGKWSQAVIGGVLLGDALTHSAPAQAWSNGGGVTIPLEAIPPEGSGWYNRRPPGGWYNRRPPGGWYNRGGGWYNRRPHPGWHNRGGGWHDRGGGWYNRGGGYRRVPGWDDR